VGEGLGKASKLQPVIIIAIAVIGILLGQNAFILNNTGMLIEPFLMVLLFLIFLKVDLREVGAAFKNIKFSATSLAINFIWTPIFAVLLGMAFLGDSMDMRIGFLMLMVTPCTDWYIVFTALTKGNVSLSTAILPLNLIIQVLLLPVYLLLFIGTDSSFDTGSMLLSIIYVLAIPFILANLTKIVLKHLKKQERSQKIMDTHGDNMQLIALCMAVLVMFASQGDIILDNPTLMLKMLIPLGIFFGFNLLLSRFIGRRMGFSFDDTTSLTFTTLARNSPLALAIAVVAFPEQPLIALILVIGPLIELPVLSLVSWILMRKRKDVMVENDTETIRSP